MARNSAYIRTQLTGVAELRATLKGLSDDMQQTILGEAVNAAAAPVVRIAKAMAPKRTGALKQSIGSVVRKPKKSANAYAVVGPLRGYYSQGKRLAKNADRRGADQPANYAHLVEFGHVKVKPVKGSTIKRKRKDWKPATTVGFVPPKPFLRPAFAAAAAPAGAAFESAVMKGIEKARRKFYRRQVRLGNYG
jgi:HK97 gp10 family phage protein